MNVERRVFFTAREKILLKDLVGKYKDIIECKQTDCFSSARKKQAWMQLSKEFNSIPGTNKRTVYQLRKCWENTKMRFKKKLEQGRVKQEDVTNDYSLESSMEKEGTNSLDFKEQHITIDMAQEEKRYQQEMHIMKHVQEQQLHDIKMQQEQIKLEILKEQLKQEKLKSDLLEKQSV